MNPQTKPENTLNLNKDATKPVIKCVYHKDQIVTNFCSAPECQHPLCPVCVAHHIQDHKNYRDFASFDTYEEVLDKTNNEINDFLRSLKLRKDKIDKMEGNLVDQEANLKKQLNVAHNKAKVLLDDYFRTLESELSVALQVSKEKFNKEKLKNYEKLQRQAEVNVNYGLGLYDSDKSVRALLTYLHNDQKENNQQFLKSLGDMTEFKALQVKVDSSKLHEIHVLLSKYVEINNIPLVNPNESQLYEQQLTQQNINQIPSAHQFSLGSTQQPPRFQQNTLLQQQFGEQTFVPSAGSSGFQQSVQLQQQPSMPAVLYDVPQVQQGQQQLQQQQIPQFAQTFSQQVPVGQQQQQIYSGVGQQPHHAVLRSPRQQVGEFERGGRFREPQQQQLIGGERQVFMQSPVRQQPLQPIVGVSPYQSQEIPVRDHMQSYTSPPKQRFY